MGGISRYKEQIKLIYHPVYLTPYSTADCESPERVRAIMAHLSSKLDVVRPEPCSEEDILRCHTHSLLAQEKNSAEPLRGGRLAAGGAIRAASEALDGFAAYGSCGPPPPRHPDHNWVYCFSTTWESHKKLLHDKLIESAVILDIVLHYDGDGTEAIFRAAPHNPGDQHHPHSRASFCAKREARSTRCHDRHIRNSAPRPYEHDWGGNLSTRATTVR